MSCWTWNRSLTSLALGNEVRTVSIMAEDKSVVTSVTSRRFRSGIFLSTNAPERPWAALFVSTV